MRADRTLPAVVASVVWIALFAAPAAAQENEEVLATFEQAEPTERERSEDDAAPDSNAPVADAGDVETSEEGGSEASVHPAVIGADTVAVAPGATVSDATPAEAEEPASDLPEWLRGFSIMAFADAYAQGIWTLENPFGGDQSAILGHRAYDTDAGLTLSFLGIDVAYRYESVGAVLNVRFGSSVPRLLGYGLPEGLNFMKQAYVFWRPLDNLQIDFGEFDTIYGAEVSESWRNHNYSRGSVYNVVQPFYHTGFRVVWNPLEQLTLTAIAVNGWNNVIDNNNGKTFGGQAVWSIDHLRISAGYLGGPEGDRDDLWRHLGDVIVTVSVDQLELIANGDYVAEDNGDGTFHQTWGAMLSGRVRFPPMFAMALRGEVIGDSNASGELYTGTFTLELTPVEHLVIRLYNRVDYATDTRFQDPQGQPSNTVVSTILGVVVHSD